MVKIAKFFGYFFFFLAMVLLFLPKTQIYYLLEHTIKPYKVLISQERVEDTGIGLNIQDAKIYFEGINSADVSTLDLNFLLFYNTVEAQGITLSSAAKSFVPLKIEQVKVKHIFYDPVHLQGYAKGGFGEAHININLLERHIDLRLIASDRMKKEFAHTLRNLKREKNGEYSYAKNF